MSSSIYIGKFSVYDGMIYPKECSDKVPPINEILKQSLLIFLTKQEEILKELKFAVTSELNFPNCINEICYIFDQLYCRHIFCGNNNCDKSKTSSLFEVNVTSLNIHYITFSLLIGVKRMAL